MRSSRTWLITVGITGAAVVALAVGVYRWTTTDMRPPASVLVRPAIEGVEGEDTSAPGNAAGVDPGPKPWESVGVPSQIVNLVAGHEARWKQHAQLTYGSIEDRETVQRTMRDNWGRARFIRLSGRPDKAPDEQVRRAMGDVAASALHYLSGGAPTFETISQDYLADRAFKEAPMPQWLLEGYKRMFESTAPFETNDDGSKREVMEAFFDVRRQEQNSGYLLTHVTTSGEGFVGAFYWLKTINDDRDRLFELLKTEGRAVYWTGSLSSPGFFLTEGSPSLEQMLESGPPVLWAEAYFVVRTANNDRLPMRIGAYYDPAGETWHLAEINFQSSPVWAASPATLW